MAFVTALRDISTTTTMSQYDQITTREEGYDPEEKRQRYPLVKATPPTKKPAEWPDFELDYEPWEDAPAGMDMPH